MKVLVTGGAGFQGSHICEYLLAHGHKVTVLNHESEIAQRNIDSFKKLAHIIWGSVADSELVDTQTPKHDLILHLAAKIHVEESIANPNVYVRKNILGTFNILESIKKCPVKKRPRLIYWSSCEVYGQPLKGKLNELAELRPHSPYASSKAAADRLCFAYYKTYGIDVTIIRPFNIFGERQKIGAYGALIPSFIENAINKFPLTIFGKGNQTRDYMYIADLLRVFEIIFKSKHLTGQTVNFASGKDTSVAEIANYIAKKFRAKIVHAPARPGEVMKFPADISKAKRLGFKPSYSIWQGIDHYINWRLSQKSVLPSPSRYTDWKLVRKLYERFLLPI